MQDRSQYLKVNPVYDSEQNQFGVLLLNELVDWRWQVYLPSNIENMATKWPNPTTCLKHLISEIFEAIGTFYSHGHMSAFRLCTILHTARKFASKSVINYISFEFM